MDPELRRRHLRGPRRLGQLGGLPEPAAPDTGLGLCERIARRARAGAVHEIRLFTQPAAAIQDGTCEANDDTTVGLTVDALVAWLRAQPSLEAGTPEPIAIDGHPGQMLDLRLRPSWSGQCPGDAQPSAVILTEAAFHLDSYTIGLVGREQLRLILLDLGNDDVVGIVIDSSRPDRFDGLIESAMPILERLRFR